MYTEDEYILLSGIQHFSFCRRQWALIHIEQQWEENYFTVSGELLHKKAHDEACFEKRGNKLTARGLRICSGQLGVTGQCDVVEFLLSKNGIPISGYEGLWDVIPVEYKNGEAKESQEDRLQLCAQAMCLEEMFVTEIPKGYLYYGTSRRREEVNFSNDLRQVVEENFKEMHQLFQRGYTPRVKYSKKCRACSLVNLCVPKVQENASVSAYIRNSIEIAKGEAE